MSETPEHDATDQVAFLDGQVLIAMPSMTDPRFQRTLVYLCAHSSDGAMGLILNRTADDLTLGDLFERLEIPVGTPVADEPVHVGGPVETGRGFVLHSSDYVNGDSTLRVDDETAMTATLEILHAMGEGTGPRDAIVALGYAGWAPGQLEFELQQNGWLACAPDSELLFGRDQQSKWERALAKLGISAAMLSTGGTA